MNAGGKKTKYYPKRDKQLKIKISQEELDRLKFTADELSRVWGKSCDEVDLIMYSVDLVRNLNHIFLPWETTPAANLPFDPHHPNPAE